MQVGPAHRQHLAAAFQVDVGGLVVAALDVADGPQVHDHRAVHLRELLRGGRGGDIVQLRQPIGHLGIGQVTPRNGIISGAILWAGFVVTSMAVNHAFQGAKPALTLIDSGHWLGVLLIQGAVIGWMGIS